jgi:glutaminyl-tRNA synthetase
LEAGLVAAQQGERVQFERSGFFTPDRDSSSQAPIWNRIVALRDGWAKIQAKQ